MYAWDEDKNRTNQSKHGVSFENALRVFDDPLHITLVVEVKNGENRWQTTGAIDGKTVVLVVHTNEQKPDGKELIRIISARLATKAERKEFELQHRLAPTQILGHAASPNDRGWFGARSYRSRTQRPR